MLDNRPLQSGIPFLVKPRNHDLVWTAQDDALLRQLLEKWPNNWPLIAESFNSSRVTITSDRRTASDCFERWRTLLKTTGEDDSRPPQTPITPMTTRGTKRSLSMSVAAGNVAGAAGSSAEPRKRRRHNVMYEAIRKAAKKKEAALKANGMLLCVPLSVISGLTLRQRLINGSQLPYMILTASITRCQSSGHKSLAG